MSRVLPILFNTDMVRAILDGRKTVTRRKIDIDIINNCDKDTDGTLLDYQNQYGDFINPIKLCRYQREDILYVRETYCPDYFDFVTQYGNRHGYKADYDKAILSSDITEPKWTPSIHMPKAAARIWLKVTDVRVERLYDITEEQAEAEGLYKGWRLTESSSFASTARQAFMWVWDMTIKTKQISLYGWIANPWVWVIEFECCGKPEELCITK